MYQLLWWFFFATDYSVNMKTNATKNNMKIQKTFIISSTFFSAAFFVAAGCFCTNPAVWQTNFSFAGIIELRVGVEDFFCLGIIWKTLMRPLKKRERELSEINFDSYLQRYENRKLHKTNASKQTSKKANFFPSVSLFKLCYSLYSHSCWFPLEGEILLKRGKGATVCSTYMLFYIKTP